MNAFIYTYLLACYDGMTLVRPGLALTGLALLLAALLWRRPRPRRRQRASDKLADAWPHAGLPELLRARSAVPAGPMAGQAAPAAPKPAERRALPFEQARLDAMFGEDRQLQGEILALFVAETRDRLAGIAHALRCGRTAPARVLAQEIFDAATALGLGQLKRLSGAAVHASFTEDIETQRRLHADLLMALEVLSTAVTQLQQPQRREERRRDAESLP
ncbi:hypothetical protein [Janthinobacterium sp. 1_2014MBL_MicDiv]|uniref:hypothetical protein n=1 Tax=Janthinobacterium sp. 1_2014MBL_MicDiv TaxID=1644131 RepID=UPI0008F4E6BD|nr:hypothetical protein [Janthinobacterium sp. 1_2014MBL_MicDiv]APA68651.1 hypothetical protein YQ44_13505 [Janthinobacterium sp. 1_2014MBL_MicDiv]